MSGILDSKSRILDAILTVEGRRQMAAGTFGVSHVTFTDAQVAYIPDATDGHVDPTGKIYFEATNLPQDQVTFEADGAGRLLPFRLQEISVDTAAYNNISSSFASANMVGGTIVASSYNHGCSITVTGKGNGFNGFEYSDGMGVTGSITVREGFKSGFSIDSYPPSPPAATVGVVNASPDTIAYNIQSAIMSLGGLGGPNVNPTVKGNVVYLDAASLTASGAPPFYLSLVGPSVGGDPQDQTLTGPQFSSQIEGLLASSYDNFTKLQSIASINKIFDDSNFVLSPTQVSFDLSVLPSGKSLSAAPSLNSLNSIFSDARFSHLDNFLYLPPIVKTSDTLVPDKTNIQDLKQKNRLLGDYPSWGQNESTMDYTGVMAMLGDAVPKKISFVNTSMANNVIAQVFEITDSTVSKLDVVDFGKVQFPTTIAGAKPVTSTDSRDVFFVGKTYLDDRGTECFVNIFTLIFSKDPNTTNEGLSRSTGGVK